MISIRMNGDINEGLKLCPQKCFVVKEKRRQQQISYQPFFLIWLSPIGG